MYWGSICDVFRRLGFMFVNIFLIWNHIRPKGQCWLVVPFCGEKTTHSAKALQQKVSMYTKWFHWILSEFIGCSEWGLVKKQWIHWHSEHGLVNYTHIL
jgi:hypothetical protein